MPAVEVELPMGDSFLSNQPDHMNSHRSCFQDNGPPRSPSTYSQGSRSRRSYGSLSFLPSTTYEQPTAASRRTMERAPVYISPFRSVRQMKEPFQLKLPTSPSFENNASSHSRSKESKDLKEEPRELQSPIGLPPLRSCRSDQNLVVDALETFGLLPSPSLSDSRVPARLNFPLKRVTEPFKRHSPVDVSPIIPSPVDQGTHKFEEPLPKPLKDLTSQAPPLNPTSTPLKQFTESKSPGSSGKSKKRTRAGTVSSAASWAPGNLSYCESWLQGVPLETPERKDEKSREVNRRKFQIVQQNEEAEQMSRPNHARKAANLRIDTQAANHSVMFAVASKIKPKLVDISRPSSSGTTFTIPIHPPPSWRRPSTPEQRSINEISAFSPDTPQEIPDSGYVTQQSNHSSEESHDLHDVDYLDCSDMRASSEPPYTGNVPFATGIFAAKRNSKNHPAVSHKKRSSSPNGGKKVRVRTPPVSPKTVDQETLVKWWDYEWTLDQLEASIKEFPKPPLRLTSPVIILLRQNHEKELIRPFRKIFPGVPDNLLDYLCAALIARNYLVSMASTHHRRNSSLTQPATAPNNNLSRLDSVPEKARATLGINLPNSSRFQITERLMGSRSLELRKGLDRIVDKLIFTICGRQDDTLKAAVMVLTQVLEQKA